MSKKLKNIILICLMLFSAAGASLTIVHAVTSFPTQEDSANPSQDMKTIPGNPDGGMSKPDDNMPTSGNSNMGEMPSHMNGDMNQSQDNANYSFEVPNGRDMDSTEAKTLTIGHIALFAVFCVIFSAALFYFCMSLKNQKFYRNKDKLTIYILASCLLAMTLAVGTTLIVNCTLSHSSSTQRLPMGEESTPKDQTDLDQGNVVTKNSVNLSQEQTDVTIKSGGTYTFTGSFNHAIIIDAANEDIKIVLDNVEINNDQTAAIIGLAAKTITISLADGSNNTLADGGNSEYDGCIFSNAELIFEGNGTLEVNGQQNEGEGIATEAQNITFNSGTYKIASNDDGINAGGDGATITINGGTFYIDASGDRIDSNKDAVINGGTLFVMGSDTGGNAGIDTDAGYIINGGSIVALGSDMIEVPESSSKQKVVAFSLNEKIDKDTVVTLMKGNEEIISFKATKSLKTIIISNSKLTNGTYSLYVGGTHTGNIVNGVYQGGTYTKGDLLTLNNSTTFEVSKTINFFGDSVRSM